MESKGLIFMSTETKILVAIIGATLLVVGGAAMLLGGKSDTSTSSTTTVDAKILVTPDSWKIGTDSAKVTLVEFSDFQCPACKGAEPVVTQIQDKYKDKILFVYRHFPLPVHEFAMDAAVAAEAAGKQGKFWDMRDKLFKISPDLGRDKLIAAAKDIGLNTDEFTKDLDSQDLRQKVLNDESDGTKAGVDATPTFFINGAKLVGVSGVDAAISSDLSK